MFRPFVFTATVFAALAVTVSAAPKIEFDKTISHAGTVIQGKTERISASFIIRNTGDKPLKLTEVRPGCGCTGVKFDSTIAPGKSTTLSAAVNLAGFRSGTISKSIQVNSNAANNPSAKLVIECELVTPVELNESYPRFKVGSTAVYSVLSTRKDLKIVDAEFKPSATGPQEWSAGAPTALNATLTAKDTTRADNRFTYQLTLETPATTKPGRGTLTLQTNHPDGKTLTMQAEVAVN